MVDEDHITGGQDLGEDQRRLGDQRQGRLAGAAGEEQHRIGALLGVGRADDGDGDLDGAPAGALARLGDSVGHYSGEQALQAIDGYLAELFDTMPT